MMRDVDHQGHIGRCLVSLTIPYGVVIGQHKHQEPRDLVQPTNVHSIYKGCKGEIVAFWDKIEWLTAVKQMVGYDGGL